MDSFFGIGIAELFVIAVIALIVLGPERLPGAIREVMKFSRQIRNLTSELTSQFTEEMKGLEDLNPNKLLQELVEDPEEKKKQVAKAAAAAKATTTKPAAAKPTTPKPATPKPATPKPATGTTATTATTKPAATAAKPTTTKPITTKPSTTPATSNGASPDSPAETSSDTRTEAAALEAPMSDAGEMQAVEAATSVAAPVEPVVENTILPPQASTPADDVPDNAAGVADGPVESAPPANSKPKRVPQPKPVVADEVTTQAGESIEPPPMHAAPVGVNGTSAAASATIEDEA